MLLRESRPRFGGCLGGFLVLVLMVLMVLMVLLLMVVLVMLLLLLLGLLVVLVLVVAVSGKAIGRSAHPPGPRSSPAGR